MVYCQLCGDKLEEWETYSHVDCIHRETMGNGHSIISLNHNNKEKDTEETDMTRKRDGLYVHVTWLSRLMAGETCCQWAPWFKTRHTDYQKGGPPDFQLALWVAQHTEMVDRLAKEHLTLGNQVSRAEQNYFKVKRDSGLLVAGGPDLIATNSAGQSIVYDAKTGNPRNSDIIQLLLFMMLLPHSQPIYKGREFEGCIVYKDDKRCDIPAAAVDNDFKKRVSYFLDILESPTPPTPTPSFAECKFCDIADSDCSTRCETNIPRIIDGAEPNIPF